MSIPDFQTLMLPLLQLAAGKEWRISDAVERLAELRTARDDAQARLDQMAPQAELTINAVDDWEKLSLDEQRALIRATVQSAVVAPVGRGAERITLRLYGQSAG